MSRFAGLKQQRTNSGLRGADRSQVLEGSARKPRNGKKMILSRTYRDRLMDVLGSSTRKD